MPVCKGGEAGNVMETREGKHLNCCGAGRIRYLFWTQNQNYSGDQRKAVVQITSKSSFPQSIILSPEGGAAGGGWAHEF